MAKERKMVTAAHWAFWLGMFGAHRFYTGYKLIGFIQLFTFGGLGIWYFIDNFSIILNKYKDADGNPLINYNKKVAIIYSVFLILSILGMLSEGLK